MAAVVEASSPVQVSDRIRRRPLALGSPMATAGVAIVVMILLAGILAPWLAPFAPNAQSNAPLTTPGTAHLLGTDELGRDVLSRILYGIRQDALAIGVAVPIGAVVGIALGLLCGLARWLDTVLQRLFDVMLAFTALIAGVTAASIIGPGMVSVIVTIAVVNVPLFGRLTRTSVRSLERRDFVVAAQVVGASPRRVLVRHVLPNGVDPLIVQLALSLSMAVFIEGAMSFIGLGVLLPDPSLGNMLQESVNYLSQNPYYALGPMIVVTLLVMGFQLIADGLTRKLLRR
jgi:peptide/nickel transport system permease protein